MAVFVLGNDGNPLMPCSEKRARLLLERKRAIVKRVVPFVIQLTDRNQNNSELQDLEIKIDPGSKFTGICLSRTKDKIVNVISLMELEHRGQQIRNALLTRSAFRRNRRNRNTRYRKARFLNRTRPKGWLPPSIKHRVITSINWVKRLIRWNPIKDIVLESVKFDIQKLQDPEISGVEYQQGTLFEYDVKEYLLEKFNRTCVYCGCKNAVFEKDHLVPKSKGGSNGVSNLVLSCNKCNRKKSNSFIEDFLKGKDTLIAKIKAMAKHPLKDAAAVNSTRKALLNELINLGLPVSTGTGGQTKFNRWQFNVPKTHALDAACVGNINGINIKSVFHLGIKCTGRGRHQRTVIDKHGFPKAYRMRTKRVFGFQTGDLVKISINQLRELKNIIVRASVRATGAFCTIFNKTAISFNYKKCKLIQRNDGYVYNKKEYIFITHGNKVLCV